MAGATRRAEALPPPPGRHCQHRALVPIRTARARPGFAGSQRLGGRVAADLSQTLAFTPGPKRPSLPTPYPVSDGRGGFLATPLDSLLPAPRGLGEEKGRG